MHTLLLRLRRWFSSIIAHYIGRRTRARMDLQMRLAITLEQAAAGFDHALAAPSGKTLSVHIPAGIDAGMRMRLAGEGRPGLHGVPSGDLYLNIDILPHPLFERTGANLFVKVPLRREQAVPDATIRVPTLDDYIEMSLPAQGVQEERTFRIQGKGMVDMRTGMPGDLLFAFYIVPD